VHLQVSFAIRAARTATPSAGTAAAVGNAEMRKIGGRGNILSRTRGSL
jgi:hypothetical protein